MSRTLVRLEPPYSRGGGHIDRHTLPLSRGPRLVRTRTMSRWHRPRSGTFHGRPHTGSPFTTLTLWCGQSVARLADALAATAVPADEPLCGTCEGRAIGAGHPPIAVDLRSALLFEPVSARPAPPVCPAVRRRLVPTYRATRWPVIVTCPACAEPTRVRVSTRSPYDSDLVLESHPPGPGLVDPCPFHRWDRLVLRGGAPVASCGCRGDHTPAAEETIDA